MERRIVEHSIDYHVEERTLSRSFDTLEQANAFAEGKHVLDIYKSKGRFKVEYVKTKRVEHWVRILVDGEEITAETAMKWFGWREIVAAMEKQPEALKETVACMTNRNIPDWEYRFLRVFREFAKEDLVIR